MPLQGHDSWVEVPSSEVKTGQPVYADLMLGNHGNNHRDFKLAGKIPLERSTFSLIGPSGTVTNLKPDLIDRGLDPKGGYWTAKINHSAPGLYRLIHTYDAIVSYAPKRAIKSAKTYFASGRSDSAPGTATIVKPDGLPLEIIPLDDPTRLKGEGKVLVKVLFKGEPLNDALISCIPRGNPFGADLDPKLETRTAANGGAVFEISQPDEYMIAVHVDAPEETGEGYSEGTEYGATLTFWVTE
ncbi:DUF4198 domain-containing protein [Luteolibacter pohnpeiensis]|nr:DUF4198 domain-containing protein [Luteolibacter pohnpeiensis]